MEELWKEIPEYLFLEASNKGRIKYKDSVHIHGLAKRMRPLKLTGFGYYQISINKKNISVHNLVATTFIGPKPSKFHRVDHKNDNKLDNRPKNLRWITHGENTMKSKYTGGRRYFYEGELWLIKKLLSSPVRCISHRVIAKMFKCSTMLIGDVKKGLKDNHIKV